MKNNKFKKMITAIIATAAALTIVFTFTSCKGGGGRFGSSPAEMDIFEVRRGNIVQTVSTSGNVDPRYSNNYSLSASGTVLKTLEEGDTFITDDILIELESNRTELLLAQAEENIKTSQTSLDLAKLSLKQALDANHISLQLAEINEEASGKSAQSALISLENANKYLSSIKQHSEVPSYQKKQASSSVDTAEGAYDQALIAQSTTYWSNLSSQQAAGAQIAITAKNIEQAEIQLKLAAINYELLGLDSDSHMILAPYDGIVISSAYKTGEFAGPGVPAVSIASSEFVIRSAVNETDIVNMEIGQEVTITLDAYYNKELKGEIIDISPVSSNIGGVVSYIITVEPETPDDIKLFHGLSASMDITTSFLKDVLYVPIESVYEENGKESVDIVVGEDLYERVEVETGIFNYDLIEIKSGLKEGDIIVVSGLE